MTRHSFDRTPTGAQLEVIEDWLRSVGEVRHNPHGFTVVLTPELLRDFAEWVAAVQRETIAQILEQMPEGTRAAHAAEAVRTMRADH